MWEQWSPAARAVLGRAVRACPDRLVGLRDVADALDRPGPGTVHLPGREGFTPVVGQALDRAELLSRVSGQDLVGAVYLVSGLVDSAFAHRGTVAEPLLLRLSRRLLRLLGGVGTDDEIIGLLTVGEGFDVSPSELLTRYVLG